MTGNGFYQLSMVMTGGWFISVIPALEFKNCSVFDPKDGFTTLLYGERGDLICRDRTLRHG